MKMEKIYNFAFKGLLTDASLDKAGRKRKVAGDSAAKQKIREALNFELLDSDLIDKAEKMSVVYSAIHAFENSVRAFVKTGLTEEHSEDWWSKVPNKIQTRVATRMNDEAKFRWHGARGGSEIEYCDFGDLSSIIITNWAIFEAVLNDVEWVKSILSILERSRNIVMHGGSLDRQDIERIGMNIRDWIRQAG